MKTSLEMGYMDISECMIRVSISYCIRVHRILVQMGRSPFRAAIGQKLVKCGHLHSLPCKSKDNVMNIGMFSMTWE